MSQLRPRSTLVPAVLVGLVCAAGAGRASAATNSLFAPVNFSLLTARSWVIGEASCRPLLCRQRFLVTRDGGRRYVRFPGPPGVVVRYLAQPSPNYPSSRPGPLFATARDGFAYTVGKRPYYFPSLWATHDRGRHWKQIFIRHCSQYPDQLVGVGGGQVYVRVARSCSRSRADYRLFRSPVRRDVWRAVPLASFNGELAAQGRRVWAITSHGVSDRLRISVDAGRTFPIVRRLPSVNTPDGRVSCKYGYETLLPAAGDRSLWTSCATLSGSDDSHATPLLTDALVSPTGVNSPRYSGIHFFDGAPGSEEVLGVVAALSRSTVLASNKCGPLLRTTNRRVFRRVAPGAPSTFCSARSRFNWSQAAFADRRIGLALHSSLAYGGPLRGFLWKSTDGGARWHRLSLPR